MHPISRCPALFHLNTNVMYLHCTNDKTWRLRLIESTSGEVFVTLAKKGITDGRPWCYRTIISPGGDVMQYNMKAVNMLSGFYCIPVTAHPEVCFMA